MKKQDQRLFHYWMKKVLNKKDKNIKTYIKKGFIPEKCDDKKYIL